MTYRKNNSYCNLRLLGSTGKLKVSRGRQHNCIPEHQRLALPDGHVVHHPVGVGEPGGEGGGVGLTAGLNLPKSHFHNHMPQKRKICQNHRIENPPVRQQHWPTKAKPIDVETWTNNEYGTLYDLEDCILVVLEARTLFKKEKQKTKKGGGNKRKRQQKRVKSKKKQSADLFSERGTGGQGGELLVVVLNVQEGGVQPLDLDQH